MPKSSFFSPRRLALLAMLTAASIVLSRLCVIYLTPTLRVEFGNLPIFLAGLFLGPASGVIVGGLADVLGATLSGVVYCPPLTLAAMFIGLLAGLLRRWVLAKPSFWKSWSLTLLADVLAKCCGRRIGSRCCMAPAFCRCWLCGCRCILASRWLRALWFSGW